MSLNLPPNKNNLPIYTILMAIVMIGGAILALIFIPARNSSEASILIGMIVASVPGIVGSGFGERNHRDIRNGVVEQKVKAGAKAALIESGVQAVVDANNGGDATNTALVALRALLEKQGVQLNEPLMNPPAANPPEAPNANG